MKQFLTKLNSHLHRIVLLKQNIEMFCSKNQIISRLVNICWKNFPKTFSSNDQFHCRRQKKHLKRKIEREIQFFLFISTIHRFDIWLLLSIYSSRQRCFDSPNFGRKEKCRNVIMSKSNKVDNKNGTNVEMLDAYKCQHMIVRNFNALTLTHTFPPSLLFLFSTFSFFGIFMFRHFYFPPKLGLPLLQWMKISNKILLWCLPLFENAQNEPIMKIFRCTMGSWSTVVAICLFYQTERKTT